MSLSEELEVDAVKADKRGWFDLAVILKRYMRMARQLESDLASLTEHSTTEVRALVRTPPSYLSSPKDRKRGYCERWTKSYENSDALLKGDYELSRSEETHAYVAEWQERLVFLGPWKDKEE